MSDKFDMVRSVWIEHGLPSICKRNAAEFCRPWALAWSHYGAENGDRDASDAIKLILLTGCRSGEIIRLRWDEVERGHLKLKLTKTGPRDVQLSKSARRILARRKEKRLSQFVFPAPRTISQPRKDFKSRWIRIKVPAEIDPKAKVLLGEKGYDADWFRTALADWGVEVCIPSKANRKSPFRITKTSIGSAIRSRTCSENSRTGGVSMPVLTAAPTHSCPPSVSPLQ